MQLCGSLSILWHCLFLELEWKLTFSCPVAGVFQICWHIECTTFTASSFRIWNSSTGIPSPPLALFIVIVPEAHLTSHSRISGSRWVVTPSWFYGAFVYMNYLIHVFLHWLTWQFYVFSWQNSISLCPASFRIPRPNLPITPGVSWLPAFAFQSPIMKRTSSCVC